MLNQSEPANLHNKGNQRTKALKTQIQEQQMIQAVSGHFLYRPWKVMEVWFWCAKVIGFLILLGSFKTQYFELIRHMNASALYVYIIMSSPYMGLYTSHVLDPGSSTVTTPVTRARRQRRCKFVGRQILHQWCTDEGSHTIQWYEGTVFDCIKGVDGSVGAVYEVQYKGEEEPCQVDHLQEDYDSGALKFKDL
jgi:hypothetical protein